ncbi:dipeptidase [Xanthomonas sp. NCPPB 2654]|uniref:dipeptidase n=1 Tax=unclassified Xanthomonas TaxID=2643310 RepID=UPI0021E0A9BA|nr:MULTISPECIES: dipeptidase [unclassified Xanthomonas]MDL5364740.1 dipeptidase [Xanthomonas sp. NCPPB 2654]MEB1530900.1 dipeptidase [Xanthomonas campestris pv. campestris]UYC22051.1 dipeptidase [Xanthomonas sp. CFBP 8443]
MSEAWTRRRWLGLSGSALLAGLLPGTAPAGRVAASAAAPAAKDEDASEAAALYRRALVLDANTLASIGQVFGSADDTARLRQLRASGVSALKTTLGDADGDFEAAVRDIAAAQALVENQPQHFLKVVQHDDLQRAKREGRIALIFSFESASMLEDKPERIDLFRHLGVRVMQLSYNRASPFGIGCLDGDTGGVTALGREAIARMNRLGVALDLSHANAQTTRDGIALSQRPPVITHAGCSAVFAHPRNKRDRDMRALADKGGVMGIYMLPFLTEERRQPQLADYIQHMRHALDVCGEDHVGIGTDSLFFPVTAQDVRDMDLLMQQRRRDGVGAPGENRTPYLPDVNTPRKLERVADALLRHGYGARVAEKVLGLNFDRVFGEIWAA